MNFCWITEENTIHLFIIVRVVPLIVKNTTQTIKTFENVIQLRQKCLSNNKLIDKQLLLSYLKNGEEQVE